jgi:tight adherence protein C
MFKRIAFYLLLIAYCTFMAAGAVSAQAETTMKVNAVESRAWPDMTVNVNLTGPDGRAVPGVNASQFKVFEQGKEQPLTGLEFGPSKDIPLELVLAIDISGSMNADNKLNEAKAAANSFLSSLRPQDSAALVAFNDKVTLVTKATNDRGALQAGINGLQASGNTAIYDALYGSADILNQAKQDKEKRRVIVLLTDGEDTSSKYGSDAAATVAKQTGALVYTIGLGPDANDGVLGSLAAPSGGKYYKAPGADDLANIYSAIATEIASQIYLKYKSSAQVSRSYETVPIEIQYTGADGKTLSYKVTYRPPPKAVPSPTARVEINPTPIAPIPAAPEPPAGTVGPQTAPPPSDPNAQTRMYTLSAAVLAGVAVIFGTLALANVFRPSATKRRMALYVVSAPVVSEEDKEPGFRERVVSPFVDNVGRRLARLSPKGYTDHVQELLTLTGPPYKMQVGGFLAIQLATAIAVVALFLLWSLRTSPNSPGQWVIAIMFGIFVGTYFPYFFLKRRVTARKKSLLRALPGALDFLAINVEAGLGFDAALGQVVHRWHNTLTDEFALLLIDFQIGKPRKEAWRDLVQRTQLPELTTFITAMLQNEQVGASIGNLLRTQAEQMRVRRRQQAEEAARKAPVKMLFPLVFFILPGLFVVVLGPAVPQLFGNFLSFGR